MKTAMQELIDYIDSIWSNSGWEETIKEKANDLLKKEKEQIIDTHIEGQRVFDDYQHTQWTTDQAEQYYDKTYNQDRELPKDVKDMLDNL